MREGWGTKKRGTGAKDENQADVFNVCARDKVMGEHVTRNAEKMGVSYPRTFPVTSTALNNIDDVSKGYKPFDRILMERGIAFGQ
jgi:hypothetical protein